MNRDEILQTAKNLVDSAQYSDFFDEVYDVINEWEFKDAEGDENEGYIHFECNVVVGNTLIDYPVDIDDTTIMLDECAEMFDVHVFAKVHYFVENGIMYFDTCGGNTEAKYEQDGFEDVSFEEDDYPELQAEYHDLYKEVFAALEAQDVGDPQDGLDYSLDELLDDKIIEVPLNE